MPDEARPGSSWRRSAALLAAAIFGSLVAIAVAWLAGRATIEPESGLGAIAAMMGIAALVAGASGLLWGLALQGPRGLWAPFAFGVAAVAWLPFLGYAQDRSLTELRANLEPEVLGWALSAGLVVAGLAAVAVGGRGRLRRRPSAGPMRRP